MPNLDQRVAIVGFGEAATAFVSGWADDDCLPSVSAFDIKTDDPETRGAMLDRYEAFHVSGGQTLAGTLSASAVVFCVVTADQALVAAEAAARDLPSGVLWLDCNSCSPETKKRAAAMIEKAGGRYVDVAIMAPVQPKRHKVPLLVSGPHVAAAEATLRSLGMQPTRAGELVGQASSVKMLRSVMIKGLEALFAESFLAAREAGVERQVLASLEASDPDWDWRKRASYALERMMVHGERRAAEMREVAETVSALGLPAHMSEATALWQSSVACKDSVAAGPKLEARLDLVLQKRRKDVRS